MGVVLKRCFVLGSWCLAATAFGQVSGVSVRNAWVQAAPPQAKVQAAYFELHCEAKEPHVLRAASSPDFERVEFHRTVFSGQTARMESLTQVELKPGSVTRFEPGGLHLMLIGPKRSVQLGERLTLTLQFGDGAALQVPAAVRSGAKSTPAASEHAGHAH